MKSTRTALLGGAGVFGWIERVFLLRISMILRENGLYPAWEHRDLRKGNLEFHSGLVHPRRVWYDRGEIRVMLNCGDQVWTLAGEGDVLFARKQHKTVLLSGGICIRRMKHA
ncbi:hypothetical protein QUW63_01890 [Pseudoflavonifractor phocaeensis]|uniref:hypothetical protein n=1 Tax=Pseudoflavonifractor phocaeensis TaxID=1870988 RepID=UPI0025A40C78|nr:hypothetical protein [Pseudoflavonifractor phocaeensis]MDM8237852.1 hypothetical protein [Pseudoflavonifractor phocaeensis]